MKIKLYEVEAKDITLTPFCKRKSGRPGNPVVCTTNGMIYPSMKDACDDTGAISVCMTRAVKENKKEWFSMGHTFRFATESEIEKAKALYRQGEFDQ